jgi:hypothetical protein
MPHGLRRGLKMRHHDILDCLGFPSVNRNGGHSGHVFMVPFRFTLGKKMPLVHGPCALSWTPPQEKVL